MSILVFLVIVILPYVALAAAFDWGIRKSLRSPAPRRILFLYPLVTALVITGGFAVWALYGICTSSSSTAAMGYVFLPYYCGALAVTAFALSWSVFYLIRSGVERLGGFSSKLTSPLFRVIAIAVVVAAGSFAAIQISHHRPVAEAKTQPSPSTAPVDAALADEDWAALTRLAFSPKTSAADLRRIFALCQGRPPSSYPPENNVLSSLSRNPKTPPDILAALVASPESTIRQQVAANPGTPHEVLPHLAADSNALVRTWVTTHPAISVELLRQLTSDNDSLVQSYAKTNLEHRESGKQPALSPAATSLH